MSGRFRQYVSILSSILILCSLINGCAPVETPGRRPETTEFPQYPQEDEEERLTAEWAYHQGVDFLAQEDYDTAIQYFHLAAERDPMLLMAYLSLGDAYRMQERYLVAEIFYNKVLKTDPYFIPALTALGTMYWKTGNHRDSLSMYRRVLEIDPSNRYAQEQIESVTRELFGLYYDQGVLYKELGQIDQAIIEFQKAHSLYPENYIFAVEIGNLFLEQQDYVMADGYFQQVLRIEPDLFPALLGAGQVQLALQRYDEAMFYFDRALQVQSGNPEAIEWIREAERKKMEATVPPEYWSIVSEKPVTRGEIAALLMVDLMLERRLSEPDRVVIISDITTHWAKPYIIKIVQYGIMRLPPDRFFRPNEPIQKGELAFVIDTLFQKFGIPLPSESLVSFSDVHPDNTYHDAILRVYSAGLMPASDENTFGMLETIIGENVIQVFEKIKRML